jgi:anti-anti-sigma factor
MDIASRRLVGAVLLTPKGSIDVATSPALDKHLKDLIAAGDLRLVIDLSQVEYISSAGLRILLAAFKLLRKNNGDMRLIGVVRSVLNIFQIAGLDTAFPILPSLEKALAGFALDGETRSVGHATVVTLRGRLEGGVLAFLETYLKEAAAKQAHLVIDLTHVPYASVEAVRCLKGVAEQEKLASRPVHLAGTQATVTEALDLLGLLTHFKLHAKTEVALKSIPPA